MRTSISLGIFLFLMNQFGDLTTLGFGVFVFAILLSVWLDLVEFYFTFKKLKQDKNV